jgi:hypothetical protein
VHGFDNAAERDLDLLLRPDTASYKKPLVRSERQLTLAEIRELGLDEKKQFQNALMEPFLGTYMNSKPGINCNRRWREAQSGWVEQAHYDDAWLSLFLSRIKGGTK